MCVRNNDRPRQRFKVGIAVDYVSLTVGVAIDRDNSRSLQASCRSLGREIVSSEPIPVRRTSRGGAGARGTPRNHVRPSSFFKARSKIREEKKNAKKRRNGCRYQKFRALRSYQGGSADDRVASTGGFSDC